MFLEILFTNTKGNRVKTQKNGNGVLIRRTAEPRKVRISFARNGKAKEVKIWMRWFTRIDPHFR